MAKFFKVVKAFNPTMKDVEEYFVNKIGKYTKSEWNNLSDEEKDYEFDQYIDICEYEIGGKYL